MANLKDLIVNGTARIIGKTYSSEFVGNLTGDVTGNTDTATKASQDSEGNIIKDTYFKCSGGIIDGHLDIHPTNNTAGSYDEGIRIAVGKNGYSALVLGSSATQPSGTTDGQWWVGCNHGSKPRKLFISHNGADSSETYFYADSSTQRTPSLKVGGKIAASEFVGNLTGNVTGDVSGSSGSCTGNAKTATTADKTAYSLSIKDGASTPVAAIDGWNGSASKTLTIKGDSPITTAATTSTGTITITHDKKGPSTTAATSKGDTANQTPGFGGTFKVTSATVDVYGHTTALAEHTVTIPSTAASGSASGIVTTGAQTFAGAKTFADTTDSTNNTSGAVIVSGGLGVAGNIYAGAVYGAVWNDLSDSIPVDDDCDLEHGYCYCFDGEKYSKSSKYLDDGIIGIHSDTYGFKMGAEEGKKKMDVAVSGFVLAYVDKEYKPGTPLTCTKNGYLTKIKLRDKIRYPEKIIATYWKSEPADELGSGSRKVRVNGRKWVKVK